MNISGRAVGGLRRKWEMYSLAEWANEQTRETHDYQAAELKASFVIMNLKWGPGR